MRQARSFAPLLAVLATTALACGATSPDPAIGAASADATTTSREEVTAPSGTSSEGAASVRRKVKKAEGEQLRELIERGEFDASDMEVGTGASAEVGDTLSVKYVGMLVDGTVFDQTSSRPFVFKLGAGSVIQGWDRGLVHMKVGGKRRLIIPAELAYGARGAPPKIAPNSTLVFEVELVGVEP